ncbi:TraR/DksA family transcriptional regulator [Vibrio owensii]|uniref:TraR/DksA family transcriptional regulator n=1 Tax=Vibrio owensii TaxID=696485 RepID=UPI0018F26B10|nr:TraR/DksA C4-type zinc finger protein [Vibrio owensii]
METQLDEQSRKLLIDQSKQKLLELEQSCKERIEAIAEERISLSSEVMVEQVDRTQQETSLSLLRIEESRLNSQRESITQALKAIREDDFGWCDTCGLEIELDRLRLYPQILTCVHCQESKERRSRLYDTSGG